MLRLAREARNILKRIIESGDCCKVYCEVCPLRSFDCVNWAENRDGPAQAACEFLEAIDEHNKQQQEEK